MIFYKLFLELSEHFWVITVDLIGMGGSSRPKVSFKSPEETDMYFVNSLDKWREQVGLEKFILAGHSFGGYISGKYAWKHPDRVQRLLLLSPAGVGNYPTHNFDEEVAKRREEGGRVPSNKVICLIKKAWKDQISPFGILRKIGPFGSKGLVKKAVTRRMPTISAEEQHALGTYLPQVLMRAGSTEYALFVCFRPFMKAIQGLESEEIVPSLPMPVSFVYGDNDWMRMDMDGALRAKQLRDSKEGFYTEVYELKECGHHLYMENPEELLRAIKTELNELVQAEADQLFTPDQVRQRRPSEISKQEREAAEEDYSRAFVGGAEQNDTSDGKMMADE
jgi:cardiolipin-specific phospholipase